MNKILYPLFSIIIILLCIFQVYQSKRNREYIHYAKDIIESKNLTINNLLKDDLYDIDSTLYLYINKVDSSLLNNDKKTTLCLYLSAEEHCDACIEFELKYVRKNTLENDLKILYSASHKSSFNSFKEFNKDIPIIYLSPDIKKFNEHPTYIVIKDGIIKHIYKSNTSKNGGAANYFLNTIKNLMHR